MEEFYKLLPDVIHYLVGGFVFINIFRFVSNKNKISDIEHMIMASLALGYIIKNVCNKLFIVGRYQNVKYILCCIIFAYFIAQLSNASFKNKNIQNVLAFLKIYRTSNQDIWLSFLDTSKPMMLKLTDIDNGLYYVGFCVAIEENQRSPIIVLSHYRIFNQEGNIVEDCFEKYGRTVMLNTGSFSSIERLEYA